MDYLVFQLDVVETTASIILDYSTGIRYSNLTNEYTASNIPSGIIYDPNRKVLLMTLTPTPGNDVVFSAKVSSYIGVRRCS